MAEPLVRFVDLRAQHEEVRQEIEAAIKDIIDRSCFIGGPYVAAFERDFAGYLDIEEVIGVANGTDAIWITLVAKGIGPGDGVVTVPNTFIATVEAISRSGARPLFVDIDLDTATMDVAALRTFLEEECHLENDGRLVHKATGVHVKAVMPVHLYGLPADMAPLIQLARSYGLAVIEDAAQAQGARYSTNGDWKMAGTVGDAAAFSFYPGKNLGALGDAGAVATNDHELATKIRWLRDHGQREKYVHTSPQGWNSRLDAIQAAALSAKLKRLDAWNEARRRAAQMYRRALAGLPLTLPLEPPYAYHIYHVYVVRTPERDRLREGLAAQGIQVGMHYPIPVHLQEAYRHLGLGRGSFPNTERSADTLLSLPMHQALTGEQVEIVAAGCAQILNGN